MWKKLRKEEKSPSTQKCLEDFYSHDSTNQMLKKVNSIDFKTLADYARSERGLSNEEIRALWDPSSIENP